jgi:hypothetical protein
MKDLIGIEERIHNTSTSTPHLLIDTPNVTNIQKELLDSLP